MTGDKGISPTLTAAIRRVLSGDVESYEVIHNRIDRPLRAYIRSHFYWAGPDFEDEVAVRTHEYLLPRLGEYDAAKASLQTWYNWQSRSVAGLVMREWFGPRLVQYDEAVHEAWSVTASGPADVYEEKRLSRVLREESESLSDEERQSITLHDIGRLTFEESAEASGLSVMQVRYRRLRALSVLRQRLLERGVRPVAVDTTPAPIWFGRDRTDPDDYAAPTVAVLPDGPDTLVGAAAAEEKEDSETA
jgi:DNA-directed RNA polymerase specialized sigma24 family protein